MTTLRTEKFSVDCIEVTRRTVLTHTRGQPAVAFVLEGQARIGGFLVPSGGSCVIPAAARSDVDVDGNAIIVVMSTGS